MNVADARGTARVLQGAEARLIGEVIVALVNRDLYGTGLVDGTLFDGNEWEKQGWVIATEDRSDQKAIRGGGSAEG